jgi:hypothetical protein
MYVEEVVDSADISLHDRLIQAMVRILSAYGFQVQSTVKGKRSQKLEVMGDSGKLYYPDIKAQKGPWTIICEARTRGQRGQSEKLDPGAIQFAVAELADMQAALKRPHGMIVTPHGTLPEAKKLADHFGVIIALLPVHAVNRILDLDFHSQKEQILEIARSFDIVF